MPGNEPQGNPFGAAGWPGLNPFAIHPDAPSASDGSGCFDCYGPAGTDGHPYAAIPDPFSPVGYERVSTLRLSSDEADTRAAAAEDDARNPDLSAGAAIVGTGAASVTRVPIPGVDGLFLELSARGWTPKGGSTSTVFIQDISGNRVLRLDHGYNKATGGIDYHWNQKGTFEHFKIADHTPVGKSGAAVFKGARYFKYLGRTFLILGAALDVYSIVVARKRMRQITRVAAGWTAAWGGAALFGKLGAGIGTAVEPGIGTAIGGGVGGIIGGVGGYFGASWAAGEAYDWVEETYFEPIPELTAD